MAEIRPDSAYLEIGVQNMGWISILDQEHKFTRCVACDVNPSIGSHVAGTRFTDIIVGDSTRSETSRQIRALNLTFSLILDDASHTQHDIIKNFLLYFALLRDGGTFLIEDCHTDFSDLFKTTNYYGLSVYEFFGSLAALPTLVSVDPSLCSKNAAYQMMRRFLSKEDCNSIVEHINEISFVNSMIAIKKGRADIGERLLVGDEWPVCSIDQLRTFNIRLLQNEAPPPEPKIAVVYLNRTATPEEAAGRDEFIKSFTQFKPSIDYKLYVINKGFNEETLPIQYHLFSDLKPRFVDISDDGFDLTAYGKVLDEIEEETVFFMNTYSTPLSDGWLNKVHAAFSLPNVGLAACTGSYETHHPMRANFPEFPNYHARSTGFMIDKERFRKVLAGRTFNNKDDAYAFECGNTSMTRVIEAEGLKVVIVGYNGVYSRDNLWYSGIFRMGLQRNLLVSDNHTRAYANLPVWRKLRVWADTWLGLGRLGGHQLRWSWQHGKMKRMRSWTR
ncbi:hypothetical protein IVB06_16330 [Bradyrhizobium sp. 171]|nr:class I SAM-dependent methyltransferase [Bradyrhizobium sp. 176]MCK1557865.1 hypothetical protein [Bradyrhizobium sp. 171]UPJ98284.1 hypothetical protein IVB07_12720 [Bradyrhizobium sp. 172]